MTRVQNASGATLRTNTKMPAAMMACVMRCITTRPGISADSLLPPRGARVRQLLAKGPYTSAYHVGRGDKPNFVTAFEKKRPAALMNLARLEHGRRSGDTFRLFAHRLRVDWSTH